MAVTLTVGLLVGAVALLAWWLWHRRGKGANESVYDRLQMEQHPLWQGAPTTVVFDYEPYLKEPSRRKVNVHTVQESRAGVRSFIGFCHDYGEDRAFKLESVRGDILIVKSGQSMPGAAWLDALIAGELDD